MRRRGGGERPFDDDNGGGWKKREGRLRRQSFPPPPPPFSGTDLLLNLKLSPAHDDYPGPLLHLRQGGGQQVGGLPGPAAGRVHGGRCPGRTGPETLLLQTDAPVSRGPDRETPQLRPSGEVTRPWLMDQGAGRCWSNLSLSLGWRQDSARGSE